MGPSQYNTSDSLISRVNQSDHLRFHLRCELILAIEAVHHKNDPLLFAIRISSVCILAFSAMQPSSIKEIIRRLQNARDAERQPLVDLDIHFWKRFGPAQNAYPIIFGIYALVVWPCAY